MLDSNDLLIALADTINGEVFDDSFEKYTTVITVGQLNPID